MSIIRILPDQVANRIAAGEVIERPVAVVKELVDNSIDAGADRIRVQFKQGGKSYILVEDNGKGMAPDDALLCLERHATSKIQSSDDLFNIQTLGFRGEAIPSIASVSRFLMRTRQVDQMEGTEILVNGGKLIHRKAIGTPPGTRMEVTHLFSSIPARRKFLKTDNTEASHIIQWMRLIAIAHPQVGFRLISNERTLLSVPAHEDLLDRIVALWGREVHSQLKPLIFESEGIVGTGYIGKAGVSRPTRQDMVTIVNGRPVESRTLGFAFTEAYHTHIPKGRYPLVFLQLKVDPSMVDVNIHPSKKEIKFKHESKIRTLIIQNVWAVLREGVQLQPLGATLSEAAHSSLPTLGQRQRVDPTDHEASVQVSAVDAPQAVATGGTAGTDGHAHAPVSCSDQAVNVPPREYPQAYAAPVSAHAHSQRSGERVRSQTQVGSEATASASTIEREWRFIGDYHRSYSLFERTGGLSLVHNSRALRRIGYEKVLRELSSNVTTLQHDIVPTTIELEAHTSARLKQWLSMLAACGIVVEEFGRNFYRIEAVPSMMEGVDARQLIEKWLHLDADTSLDSTAVKTDIALVCCGKYRKQLDLPLRKEVAIDVLRQLLCCDQPMVDPEGAPVIQHIPHRVFEKFKSLEVLS